MKSIYPILCILALLFAAGCATPTPDQVAQGYYGDRPTPEQAQEWVQGFLKYRLKDYSSAQFEWVRLHKAVVKQGAFRYGYVQELMVNAKNSYGGYNGFKPYAIFIEGNGRVQDVTLDLYNAPVGFSRIKFID